MQKPVDRTDQARAVLDHCEAIAKFSEVPGQIVRTFLTGAARLCQQHLTSWMQSLGMQVRLDAAGNLRGFYAGEDPSMPSVLIGSHLDTVPNAGAYDGTLGVVMAIMLIEALMGERLRFGIEVIGFSEEEGVRFGLPFIGSRALAGELDEGTLERTDSSGISVAQAIANFGLDPSRLREAALTSPYRAYLEFHIEQGPVLDNLGLPLAAVDAIAGQTRASVRFVGRTNHAGTTPMHARRDALCAAAEWISRVEQGAQAIEGLVATVGTVDVKPGATNVIAGDVTASLDVRHATDSVRTAAFAGLVAAGEKISRERRLLFEHRVLAEQNAVAMDQELTKRVEQAIQSAGAPGHRMTSGAGHDAMIIADKLPSAMIFLRSPKGISHHPDETVHVSDVALALDTGVHLLRNLSECPLHI